MLKKLKNKQYKSKIAFQEDLQLIYDNCMTYNQREDSPYRTHVREMRDRWMVLMKQVPDIVIRDVSNIDHAIHPDIITETQESPTSFSHSQEHYSNLSETSSRLSVARRDSTLMAKKANCLYPEIEAFDNSFPPSKCRRYNHDFDQITTLDSGHFDRCIALVNLIQKTKRQLKKIQEQHKLGLVMKPPFPSFVSASQLDSILSKHLFQPLQYHGPAIRSRHMARHLGTQIAQRMIASQGIVITILPVMAIIHSVFAWQLTNSFLILKQVMLSMANKGQTDPIDILAGWFDECERAETKVGSIGISIDLPVSDLTQYLADRKRNLDTLAMIAHAVLDVKRRTEKTCHQELDLQDTRVAFIDDSNRLASPSSHHYPFEDVQLEELDEDEEIKEVLDTTISRPRSTSVLSTSTSSSNVIQLGQLEDVQ